MVRTVEKFIGMPESACKPDGTFYLVARWLFLQHDREGQGGELNLVLTVWGLRMSSQREGKERAPRRQTHNPSG